MSRSIALANGKLAVALDAHAQVRDVYYPHVGQEDHMRGHHVHRLGVWVDGHMSWLSDAGWDVSITCEDDALISHIIARNTQLQIELVCTDTVHHIHTAFMRRIEIINHASAEREIKLYCAQQFEIYKSLGGDSAFYDPDICAIVHYKIRRAFLVYGELDGVPMNDYAIGRTGYLGQEGTYRDADDGILSKNGVEHGPVDSVAGLYARYSAGQSRVCHASMIAAQSIDEAKRTLQQIQIETVPTAIESTRQDWCVWLHAYDVQGGMSTAMARLYTRSLMHMKAHIDHAGGIIASLDSDMLGWGYDTYAYVWPRDAAYVALVCDEIGDTNTSRRFFEFCARVIGPEGYLLHKYWADGSIGSSWHPWIQNGERQLPIQEDETAIVVWGLYQHFLRTKDLEFLEKVFERLVEKPCRFMMEYRSRDTGLPLPSYDLWERTRMTSTYTTASVYGACVAAAHMAESIGKYDFAETCRTAAQEIKRAIEVLLWDEGRGYFYNGLVSGKDGVTVETTVDVSSVHGITHFGVYEHTDPRVMRAWNVTYKALTRGIGAGGIARFENDDYFRDDATGVGNPWILTTLWYAEYCIRTLKIDEAKSIFDWVIDRALPSGVLAEQAHPKTGEPVGSMPLAWSHASYVHVLLQLLKIS